MKSKSYHHGNLKKALIDAGTGILSDQGLGGLSLRKVAERAGVSHAAPYAHFSDKQELVAAIATEGFHQLFRRLSKVVSDHPKQHRQQLMAIVRAYAAFAVENTETFKLMFSSTIEKEKLHPELIAVVRKVSDLVNAIVKQCVEQRIIKHAAPDLAGVFIWGQVHGIILLWMENQIPSKLLRAFTLKRMVQRATECFLIEAVDSDRSSLLRK